MIGKAGKFRIMGNAELFCHIEEAVKYNFCYFIPYITRKRKIEGRRKEKITRESEWIRTTLSKDKVIRSLGYEKLNFNLTVKSKRFPLKAKVDMLVIRKDDYIPVFAKSVNFRDDYNWKLEIVGKVVLLEEFLNAEINKALVFFLENREWVELSIFPSEKRNFIQLANRMKERPLKLKDKKCDSCELKDACAVLPGWI
ncbi:hypothetical protein DRP07_12420 [Archaeoglobales archaeon]|nr:MAG: hypothetical protein DRP07_12420 [Archaeoglobales archaeon]